MCQDPWILNKYEDMSYKVQVISPHESSVSPVYAKRNRNSLEGANFDMHGFVIEVVTVSKNQLLFTKKQIICTIVQGYKKLTANFRQTTLKRITPNHPYK